MDLESLKFTVGSVLQLLVAIGAWTVAIVIHRGNSHKQNEELRIKLYQQRYDMFLAFREFIAQSFVQDVPPSESISQFQRQTERVMFLFGKEIVGYRKELVANAIAIVGIVNEYPCSPVPVVGGIVGYFPGSSTYDNLMDLRRWFSEQHSRDLEAYFEPYLDFSKAGVNLSKITMQPTELPDPPLVRRRVSRQGGA